MQAVQAMLKAGSWQKIVGAGGPAASGPFMDPGAWQDLPWGEPPTAETTLPDYGMLTAACSRTGLLFDASACHRRQPAQLRCSSLPPQCGRCGSMAQSDMHSPAITSQPEIKRSVRRHSQSASLQAQHAKHCVQARGAHLRKQSWACV